jgi:periplasmic protein TonB
MPHELLGDVLRAGDSDGRSRRRRYVLPLSIAAHTTAAGAILIIPLAAEVELPVPMRPAQQFVHVVAEAPRPVVVRLRGVQAPPRAQYAPSEAPPAIVEETIVPEVAPGPPGPPSAGPIGTPSGLDPRDLGITGVVIVPPPPPDPPTILRIGGDVREPRKIVDVPPIYPPLAIAARKEGIVILEAMLDEKGNVQRLKVLRSEPLLDDAAVQAVRRWRHTPTLLNGTPVPVLMTVTVRFSLR